MQQTINKHFITIYIERARFQIYLLPAERVSQSRQAGVNTCIRFKYSIQLLRPPIGSAAAHNNTMRNRMAGNVIKRALSPNQRRGKIFAHCATQVSLDLWRWHIFQSKAFYLSDLYVFLIHLERIDS